MFSEKKIQNSKFTNLNSERLLFVTMITKAYI